MNKPTFYEQAGIIIPGALLLVGVVFFYPGLGQLTGATNMSLGEFGIFILLSYAAGHFVAAIGNAGENVGWSIVGGMPTNWVLKEKTDLISPQQRDRLKERVKILLQIEVTGLQGLDRKAWHPIVRQMYAHVMQSGKPDRIETFNGNYGLNRGLSAASAVLTVIGLVEHKWLLALAFVIAALVFGYRAYRFGVHYARELFVQFLAIGAG